MTNAETLAQSIRSVSDDCRKAGTAIGKAGGPDSLPLVMATLLLKFATEVDDLGQQIAALKGDGEVVYAIGHRNPPPPPDYGG